MKEKEKEKELFSTITVECMRGSGTLTKGMEKDMKGLLMEISIRDSIVMEKHKGKVFFIGHMVKFMMENGLKVSKKAMESGMVQKGILISDNG